MPGNLKKWMGEVVEALPDLAKIGTTVAAVALSINPTTAWALILLQASSAILAGRYVQKAIPDSVLPDSLKTGTSGMVPKQN